MTTATLHSKLIAYPCGKCGNTSIGVRVTQALPNIDTSQFVSYEIFLGGFRYSIGCNTPQCRYACLPCDTVDEAIKRWNRNQIQEWGVVKGDLYNAKILQMCRWLQDHLETDEYVTYTRIRGSGICPGAHKVSLIKRTNTAADKTLSWLCADSFAEDFLQHKQHRDKVMATLWLNLGKLRGIEEVTE